MKCNEVDLENALELPNADLEIRMRAMDTFSHFAVFASGM
jgi:hypothetical protein